ncbi:MAG: hypothetical protein L6R48_19940 [Planctomycetes bacterium]|nr:hypothetical protein [Planctomycetota bacterium]
MTDLALDVPALTALTMACFEAAQDADRDEDARRAFAAQARRLRAHLVTLVSARFAAGTPAFTACARQLTAANAGLERGRLRLADSAATIQRIDRLLKGLDRLAGVAARFL